MIVFIERSPLFTSCKIQRKVFNGSKVSRRIYGGRRTVASIEACGLAGQNSANSALQRASDGGSIPPDRPFLQLPDSNKPKDLNISCLFNKIMAQKTKSDCLHCP